jgi:hypothetical protein
MIPTPHFKATLDLLPLAIRRTGMMVELFNLQPHLISEKSQMMGRVAFSFSDNLHWKHYIYFFQRDNSD